MNSPEKSYLEIKVTLLHIVILLAGVIIIGIFLFYLGYQAGKSSLKNRAARAQIAEQGENTREINILDDNIKIKNKTDQKQENAPSIKEEEKLHQQPFTERSGGGTEQPIKERTVKKESYYTVQVGAFSSFTNAKNYSDKFMKMGYPAEVLATTRNKRTLYRVRVGNFKSRTDADKEKVKLEKLEKKKFAVVKFQ